MAIKSFIKATNNSDVVIDHCIFKGDRALIDSINSKIRVIKSEHTVSNNKKNQFSIISFLISLIRDIVPWFLGKIF